MVKWPSLTDISASVRSGEVKASDLVEKSLNAIASNKEFDAIINNIEDRARMRAREVDSQVTSGRNPGRLAGVPFIAKDNFVTYGSKTTAAANYLKNYEAPYQATAINLLEAEGAICVAKANLDAWAHGSSTENSDFFTTKNPYDKTRVPGGSSGGSAAAVALGLAPLALGTDTGGSIRQPAAFCGLVGYKPTYGLVSRSGVIAMTSSADVIGPITRNVEDAALALDIMASRDELDSTTIERADKDFTKLNFSWRGKKVGIINEYMVDGIDVAVKKQIEGAVKKIKNAGASIGQISMPSLPLSLAVYYIVCPAEVSSNLARFDGQRYGLAAKESKNLLDSYEFAREQGFGDEAKRRIMIGTYVLSSGYYDAYYKKAQTVRTKIRNEFDSAFKKFDLLVGPTTPTTAFKIGEKTNDLLQMYLNDVLTVAANISGNPAISVPVGKSGGLPIGFQIIGPMRGDLNVLAASKAFEEING